MVLVREAFRRADVLRRGARSAGGRSRKNPDLYTGAQALVAIVEGNPRWFISIISPLAEVYRESGGKRVPRPKQAIAVRDATNRFRAFLKTLPYATSRGGEPRGLLHFLDAIGNYFHREVVQNDFEPEPPLSFTVDSNSQPTTEEAVEKAVHAGALVYVPDPQSTELLSSVRGKRFRLSYMLASRYRLPLRLGKSRSLSRVLRDANQEELFDDGSR